MPDLGVQQVLIKWAAPDIAPVMQAAARSGISALLVGLLICWKGGWGQVGNTWRGGLLAGALFGLEFLFIAEGLQLTTAAHMSVFLYTAPIFTALGVHFLLASERLRPLQWLGILLAFIGIAIAFAGGVSWDNLDRRMLLGDAFGVLAGACWGATTVVVRASRLSEAPVTLTLFYQLIVGFLGLLLIALFSGQITHVSLTTVAIASVLFQGLIVSFLQLSGLVLAAASLSGGESGGVFVHDAAVRGDLWRVAAGRTTDAEFRSRRRAGAARHHLRQRRAVAASAFAQRAGPALDACIARPPAISKPQAAITSAGCRPPLKWLLNAASNGPLSWPTAKQAVSKPALR